MTRKKEIINTIILFILVSAVTIGPTYLETRKNNNIEITNDEMIKNRFESVSESLIKYKNANEKEKISLASNITYNLVEARFFYVDSSYSEGDNLLSEMFTAFEDYIKFDNSIEKVLDVNYIEQLSVDFKNLSINPIDNNSIEDIRHIMSDAYNKQFDNIN